MPTSPEVEDVADLDDLRSDARIRRAQREARTEAVLVLAVDVALLGGLAALDRAKGWDIIEPWWVWLLLAAPGLILIVLLLAVPLPS